MPASMAFQIVQQALPASTSAHSHPGPFLPSLSYCCRCPADVSEMIECSHLRVAVVQLMPMKLLIHAAENERLRTNPWSPFLCWAAFWARPLPVSLAGVLLCLILGLPLSEPLLQCPLSTVAWCCVPPTCPVVLDIPYFLVLYAHEKIIVLHCGPLICFSLSSVSLARAGLRHYRSAHLSFRLI